VLTALEATELKLKRAADCLKDIDKYIVAYARKVLHEVVPNAEGEDTVHVSEFPPSEIGVLAGEVLYQVRSSLDYLAFDLVKLNPRNITLRKDWEEHCCFPLRVETPNEAPVYNCFKSVLPGISKPAFAFIEGLQPYNRRDNGGLYRACNILWLLAELSNIDKHRHLNVTPINIGHIEMTTTKVGQTHFAYRAIRSGAKLESALSPEQMANAVQVERTFSTYITFDESVLGMGMDQLAVQLVLQLCLDTLNGIIIPAFREFLKKP
jgi:hypothetical protein